MTDPIAQAAALSLPRWGVWDDHELRWLSDDHHSERDAWAALLVTESLHPMLLTVRQLPEPDADVNGEHKCPKCEGDGYCWHCDEECRKCDGDGWLTARQWAEHQEEEKRREKARQEARERRAAREAAEQLVAS